MKLEKISKTETLVNVSNSLLGHFGCKKYHESYKILDNILSSCKKNIAFILLDGLGVSIQEKTKNLIPTIYRNRVSVLSSVYVPTTVSSTTSFLSGRYPIETGWLGWTSYHIPSSSFALTFSNRPANPEDPPKINIPETYAYENIIQSINKKNPELKAKDIYSFNYNSIESFFSELEDLIKTREHKFLYAYCTEPDSSLHHHFLDKHTENCLLYLDTKIRTLQERYPDTLFIVTADHSHCLVKHLDIREHSDFMDTLEVPLFWIEPRFSSFQVKAGREQEFALLSNKYFPTFIHYTKKELLEEEILGYGTIGKGVDDLLGTDFLIATGEESLMDSYSDHDFISAHAGGSKEEREIALSVLNR